MLRPLGVLGAVGVVLVALLVVVVWTGQRRLIYLPATGPVPAAGEVLPGARDVELRTADGERLGAWFVPARGPSRAVTVLVASGNAGDRTLRAPLARALSARGLDVLLFDYRGFGDSTGSPSEQGLAEDARAARHHLVDQLGVDPGRLLYLGESLGAGVMTRLATEHEPAGLVLRSPFTDLASLGRVHYPVLPVRALLRDRYPVAEQVRRVRSPVSVVYGTADTVVPAAQSRAVAAAAPTVHQQVAVPGADHNDAVLSHGRALVDAVVALADALQR